MYLVAAHTPFIRVLLLDGSYLERYLPTILENRVIDQPTNLLVWFHGFARSEL